MSRASIPESDRRDFFLDLDEFQNLSTESFATILSETREYHLGLILANQYLGQIDDHTRSAVFGNVGSLLTFNLGSTDAETIATQLGPDLTPRDLMSLPKFTAYARLLVNGIATRSFSLKTIPQTPNAD
jgi:type IV secretory pathway TraG/TraD family ATPase VirD4